METLPPFSALLPSLAALVASGLIAGFLAGLFGIGGGAILVPVFYQMLGALGVDESVRMHVSVGTSLAIIVPTSLRSFQAHYRRGAVDMDLLRSYLVPVPIGVIAASLIAAYLSSANLRIIFAVLVLVIAAKLLFAKDNWKLGSGVPKGWPRAVAGFFIGLASTFMGIGGGVLNNTFMSLFGHQMITAVATSAGVGVLISIPGTIGYIWAGWGAAGLPLYSLGFVNLLMFAVIVPMTLLIAPLGVRMAHTLSKRQLEVGFGIFLVIVSVRFFVSLY